MRERRWETAGRLTFRDALAVGERLAALGVESGLIKPQSDSSCTSGINGRLRICLTISGSVFAKMAPTPAG